MAIDPGHDTRHGSGAFKRLFASLYSSERLYEMGSPHIIYPFAGGPSHARPRLASEFELVEHLLRPHLQRFYLDASFIFLVHFVIQRPTVVQVMASFEEFQKLTILVGAPADSLVLVDATRAKKAAALGKCIDAMSPQMKTVEEPGGAGTRNPEECRPGINLFRSAIRPCLRH